MGYEALMALPVAFLVGYMVFEYMIRSRWGGYALWLQSAGERLSFFMWPRPPYNIVHLIMPNGDHALLYNLNIRERKDGVLIETPLGYLRSPEKGSTVLPLTAVYLPGYPNPMSLVVYAIAGLITAWIVYYYGYLFLGLPTDATFGILSLVFMFYIYLYYNAASTSGVEYHEYEVRGLAPPYLHAIPSSTVTSPIKQAKYLNIPIHIRVTKTAREALEAIKNALGVSSESEIAELLATGEFTEIVMRKAAALKVEATRVQEIFSAFHNLRFAFGRFTVGRAVLLLIVFIIGVAVGFALSGGGGLAIGPPPQAVNATAHTVHTVTHVVHNATMGGVP